MDRRTHAFGDALAIAVVLTALIFALKAAVPAFEEWAEETLGHAWLSMGLLALAVFGGLGLGGLRLSAAPRGLSLVLALSVIGSGAVIVAAAFWLAVSG